MFNTAKAAAANSYLPALIISNVVYLLLWLGRNGWNEWSLWKALGMIIVWGLQWYAYVGILHAAQNKTITAKMSLATGGNNNRNKALVGGSLLDLLALTCIIQYGSVLWSWKVYWLLIMVPPWGAWNLYKTFYTGGSGRSM